MRIGIRVPSPKPTAIVKPSFIAAKAEELGFESVWFPEHPIVPVDTGTEIQGRDHHGNPHNPKDWSHFPDPFVSLAHAAAATSTIKIGTGICLLPQRDPLVLAKETATLDHYSDGRFMLGVGAGWIRQEAEIMGVNFKRRWGQTREAALALKTLWTEEEAEFHGEFYDFPAVWCSPKPLQTPHPPILVGSAGKSAFKHVVEWGDEWMPTEIFPERLEAGRREMEAHAKEMGRDPASLKVTMWLVNPERDEVKSYFDAGADRVVVRRWAQTNTEAELAEDFERIAEKVL